jgi:hypothetical protein
MLPIVGNSGAKLNVSRLLEDFDQLLPLVFTSTPIDPETGDYEVAALKANGWLPSRLATLHAISYTKAMREALEELTTQQLPEAVIQETQEIQENLTLALPKL